MKEHAKFSFWYSLIAIIALLVFQSMWTSWRTVEALPYSALLEQLAAGNVEEVWVSENQVRGRLITALPSGRSEFVTVRVDPELADALVKYKVKFSGAVESNMLRELLGWIVPTALLIGFWYLMIRRMQGGAGAMGGGLLSVGKSRAKVYVETDIKVSFDDVAGVDEAKAELQEIVGFLRQPGDYGRLGARLPKGILLVGPPGTGKTLLAKAVAGEAGVPFFSINGSEFVEMFVGVGAARVRDLFEEAGKKAPAIIFIDEIDALGRARGAFGGFGGHDEKEQTLNQLLAELDGFDPRRGLVLLAATNRPEILDPALLRAGRFDRQVLVDRPDRVGRAQILAVHAKKIQIDPALALEAVAALTPGFTGADLANLVNEAAITATRAGRAEVGLADFTVAIERIVAGLEKRNRLMNPTERRVVAVHEMGHAIVAMSLPGQDPVQKVSIIPRGIGALGYTMQRPIEDRYLMTRRELENKMAVLLGGRAAEQLVFGEVSTGAADDLDKVSEIARSLVTRYGMSEQLGAVVYEPQRQTMLPVEPMLAQPRSYAEATAREIDQAIRKFVDAALAASLEILTARREALDAGSAALLARETLAEADLQALLGPGTLPAPAP